MRKISLSNLLFSRRKDFLVDDFILFSHHTEFFEKLLPTTNVRQFVFTCFLSLVTFMFWMQANHFLECSSAVAASSTCAKHFHFNICATTTTVSNICLGNEDTEHIFEMLPKPLLIYMIKATFVSNSKSLPHLAQFLHVSAVLQVIKIVRKWMKALVYEEVPTLESSHAYQVSLQTRTYRRSYKAWVTLEVGSTGAMQPSRVLKI